MPLRKNVLSMNVLSQNKIEKSIVQEQQFLTEKEAASLLNLSVRTLRQWRLKGEPPLFHKFGKAVRYSRSDINDFIASTRQHSTTS